MLRSRNRVASAHRFAAVTVLFLLLAASPARAQVAVPSSELRSGFWLSLGGGSGWDIPGTIVPKDWPIGWAGFVRAGGTVTPQVLFGGEVIGRMVDDGTTKLYRGNAVFTMLIYPSDTGVVFIKGGVGPAFVGESLGGGYRGTYELGLGLTGGVGMDMHFAGSFYLTSGIDYLYQSFYAGPNLRSTHRLLIGTFGFTWH